MAIVKGNKRKIGPGRVFDTSGGADCNCWGRDGMQPGGTSCQTGWSKDCPKKMSDILGKSVGRVTSPLAKRRSRVK